MDYRYSDEVDIPVDGVVLKGDLGIPSAADTVIIFSHGSGSSRFSSRNRAVATYLRQRNFGTLLFDLLTTAEDLQFTNRFDIGLLTRRLAGVTRWLEKFPAAKNCRIGYFGASTGAAAALSAAAALPNIGAVVSRGGRPDLAAGALPFVHSPTLLIAGSRDTGVITLNEKALQLMHCEARLEIIDGASHLFEEPGTLEEVMRLAAGWFAKTLRPLVIK